MIAAIDKNTALVVIDLQGGIVKMNVVHPGSGLYRTFVYIGAIASGAQLKSIFRKGLTDASFRELGRYATCSALILIVLYIPVWFRQWRRRVARAAAAERAE